MELLRSLYELLKQNVFSEIYAGSVQLFKLMAAPFVGASTVVFTIGQKKNPKTYQPQGTFHMKNRKKFCVDSDQSRGAAKLPILI